MKLNNNGFTLVEGLLIVLVITMLGGVGFYVYDSNKKAQKVESSTSPAQTTESKPVENQKEYLEIKELGIKFELSDGIKDAYYQKIDGHYYLSVRRFNNDPKLKACTVDKDAPQYGIAAITYGKLGGNLDASPEPGDVWTIEDFERANMKKVGDTYYSIGSKDAACFFPENSSPEAAEEARALSKEFNKQQSTIIKI